MRDKSHQIRDWCQRLASLPSKQMGPVRIRYLGPMVRRQVLKVTKKIGSPNNGTLGGPTPLWRKAPQNQGCEIHRDYVRLKLRTEP